MIRLFSILMPSILLLTACHHVSVHVIPDGADITVRQKTLTAPADIHVFPFLPVTASISAKGCTPVETTIAYSTPSPLDIVLKRQFKAESIPSEAEVFLNDSRIGKTPVEFELPANQQEAEISFRRNGFSKQDIRFSPATADKSFFIKLVPNKPAFLHWTIKPSKYGRAQLVSNTVRAEKDFKEPGNNQPVSIVQLTGEQQQILSFTLLPEGNGILASVLVQTQDTPVKHEARIIRYSFPQPEFNQEVLTKGNIDLTPTIMNKSSVLFASNRTGRLDLWKCRLLPNANSDQKLDLIHSSELIMLNPKIRPNGRSVLVTVYQPDKLAAPQIWSFTLDGSKNILPEFFQDGENPSWSPNGRRIAFQKGEPSAIYKIESDGSLLKPLSPSDKIAFFKQPAWSPDGKHIAFVSNKNAPQSPDDTDIWIMNADGSNPFSITSSQALDDMPVWAPDGKSIYFRSNRNLHWGIWNIQVPESL